MYIMLSAELASFSTENLAQNYYFLFQLMTSGYIFQNQTLLPFYEIALSTEIEKTAKFNPKQINGKFWHGNKLLKQFNFFNFLRL